MVQLFNIDIYSSIVVTQLDNIITLDSQTGFHIRVGVSHSFQRLLHLILIDISEVQQDRNVVLQGIGVHHPVNIHTALAFIQRIPFPLVVRLQHDGLLGILCQRCDFPNRRMLHDILHQNLDTQTFLDGGRQTHRSQRRESQGNQVIGDTKVCHLQGLRNNVEDVLLHFRFRSNDFGQLEGRFGQCLAVGLSVRRQRDGVYTHIHCRHHIFCQ